MCGRHPVGKGFVGAACVCCGGVPSAHDSLAAETVCREALQPPGLAFCRAIVQDEALFSVRQQVS